MNHIFDQYNHGRRQRWAGRTVPPWIFIHGTDKVDGGLMVLCFGLILFRWPPLVYFSADALEYNVNFQ